MFLQRLPSLLVLAAPAALAHAQGFEHTLVVDTSTPAPGGAGHFAGFDADGLCLSEGQVVFEAWTDPVLGSASGLYSCRDGAVELLADATLSIPGGVGLFGGCSDPMVHGDDVAFLGHGGLLGTSLFRGAGGSFELGIELVGTAIPGGIGLFTSVEDPCLSAGRVAFRGLGLLQAGIYVDGGSGLELVADLGTVLPGGLGILKHLGSPSISGDNVCFLASHLFGLTDRPGVYARIGGVLVRVADTTVGFPGLSGAFTAFARAAIHGDTVAFVGLGGSGQFGLFTWKQGLLATLANHLTPAPGGGSFTGFGNVSIHGPNVAFEGLIGGFKGVFLHLGGELRSVLRPGDVLDGKLVASVGLPQAAGLSGHSVALVVDFTDGSQGIYVSLFSEYASYCTAGVSASGCQATLAATGVPSASAESGFQVSASGVEGDKVGIFFFGTNGRQANPWGNGSSYQCVVPPVSRGGLLDGIGTKGQCDGAFAQDLNARWAEKPAQNPGAGALVQTQLWYRDPASTSNQTTSLSDAIEVLVAP